MTCCTLFDILCQRYGVVDMQPGACPRPRGDLVGMDLATSFAWKLSTSTTRSESTC